MKKSTENTGFAAGEDVGAGVCVDGSVFPPVKSTSNMDLFAGGETFSVAGRLVGWAPTPNTGGEEKLPGVNADAAGLSPTIGVSTTDLVANGLEFVEGAKGLDDDVDQGFEEAVPKAGVEPKADGAMDPKALEIGTVCRPENADGTVFETGAGVPGLGVAGAVTKGVEANGSGMEPKGLLSGAAISSVNCIERSSSPAWYSSSNSSSP